MRVAPTRPPDAGSVAPPQGRIGVLDSVRGVAALVVLVHHCLLTQPAFSDFFFSTWATASHSAFQWLLFHTPVRLVWDGAEAVILFYVLSGLVLALPAVGHRPPDYPSYAIKRICRIYIPYCVSIAGAAVLNEVLRSRAALPGASEWLNAMTWTNPVTAASLADHALMIGHHNTVNGVIHTLIWEMRVSLVFPFMLIPIVRWRTRGAVLVAALLVGTIAGLQLAFWNGSTPFLDLLPRAWGTEVLPKLAYELQWTAYYAVFFVIGAVLALHLRVLQAALGPAQALCLLGAGLLAMQAHWARTSVPQDLLVGIGAACVVASALPGGPIHRFLDHRSIRWVGRISYSLYLVHVPIILAAVFLLRPFLPLPAILVPTAILCLPAGWAFHVLVEAPSTRLGRVIAGRRRSPRSYIPPALATVPGFFRSSDRGR